MGGSELCLAGSPGLLARRPLQDHAGAGEHPVGLCSRSGESVTHSSASECLIIVIPRAVRAVLHRKVSVASIAVGGERIVSRHKEAFVAARSDRSSVCTPSGQSSRLKNEHAQEA